MLKHCHGSIRSNMSFLQTNNNTEDSLPSSGHTEESLEEDEVMEEEQHMVRIYTNTILPQLDYVTVCVSVDTRVRDVVKLVLERFRERYKDDKLFYLALQLTDTNPSQEGLTRKTLILENSSRMVEYVNCQEWFQTTFILRMKSGTEVKIFISVLLEDQDWICLTLSEDTTCKQIIKMIINMFR